MSEISTLREMRPAPPPAELDAMRMAARARFVAGTGARRARRRPLAVLAGAGALTAAAAGTAAAALVLASGPGAAPGQRAPAAVSGQRGTAGDAHTRTVVTAAWTVREDADGTVTIELRQYANPAALQQTLQADGINAIVRAIPYTLQTITTPPATVPAAQKPPLPAPTPTCEYATTDRAPLSVQGAVVTIVGLGSFVIDPNAMPQGSALFLAFMDGLRPTPKNSDTGVMAWIPVVLTNDTVPACVPRTKPGPTFSPQAK